MNLFYHELLQRLCLGKESPCPLRIAVVAAHPDDEVIGAGAQLPRWQSAHFIYVTDGAPPSPADALAAGYADRQSYAQARRQEATTALRLAGVGPAQLHGLNFPDQGASFYLREAVEALVGLLRRLQPELVLTHPYEGGHPDHDATAFAVALACQRLARSGTRPPALFEMTSYHNRAGIMATGEFLPRLDCPDTTLRLSASQRRFKRRLFECFASQQRVLRYFQLKHERFRVAPAYDFTRPPHDGRLYYELFDWGMTGSRWRSLAREALQRRPLTVSGRSRTKSSSKIPRTRAVSPPARVEKLGPFTPTPQEVGKASNFGPSAALC